MRLLHRRPLKPKFLQRKHKHKEKREGEFGSFAAPAGAPRAPAGATAIPGLPPLSAADLDVTGLLTCYLGREALASGSGSDPAPGPNIERSSKERVPYFVIYHLILRFDFIV